MLHVKLLNLFNARLLVVDEYLEIDISQKIQVHFISIVADGHDKGAILIKKVNLF